MSKSDYIALDASPSVEEIKQIKERLNSYNRDQTHDTYVQPGIEIKLALKNSNEDVMGGIIASTILRVMHLEVLWVAEEYRRHGYGRQLHLQPRKSAMKGIALLLIPGLSNSRVPCSIQRSVLN